MVELVTIEGVPSSAKSNDILNQFYASALSGDSYQPILDAIRHESPHSAVLLFQQDTVQLGGNALLHRGLHPDAARTYVTSIVVENPWFFRQWALPVGYVYTDDELLDHSKFLETDFYRSWLGRQGEFDGAAGLVFSRYGTRQSVLELRFPWRDADARRKAALLLRGVGPHLVRVAEIMRLRHSLPFDGDAGSEMLEMLPAASFVLDSRCRVRAVNAQGDGLTRRAECLFYDGEGSLHAVDTEIDRALKRFVEEVGVDHRCHAWMFSTVRPRGKRLYFLKLSALEPPHHSAAAPAYHLDVDGGWRTLLTVHDGAEQLELSRDVLWSAFALTAQEADLARALLEGDTIGDYASSRQASKQTLRNLLVSVMRKTETHRQAELVALLTRLALHSRH